ncbi:MAG TPA: RNA polymerase subunit sigma-70 [Halieaceae bacterium]|jgi:RNA polymerase sigma factor (sigma-70 family)|uniref:RNA polymerase sigma factor n=1 Tax=Haliea TaxID=475794 RepID=UPI000C596947|nr:RNA polymerase sigma factor [Haliea sp.]HAN68833.1 RNA polymerase subunit sigma-70 [Halieaceae bacterium]MAA87098.1 RNA polymerase subunit sigma-70 [Haliea sp.]MAD65219.1 RNA polymerase subunit sigma-70 [Haliea sp.]MAY92981.1 RNA polymerase subunit sigma-70 [Haliea sp.]MBK40468.1 RNA polymerase subunit sigma-70 [Haliea sp.]
MPSLSHSQREVLMAELGSLRRFCLSLSGTPADADDLLQATVERILEKGMPEDADAAKWAYRVCRNAWIDELRSREVRQRYPLQMAWDTDEAPSAEDDADVERALEAVSVALNALPPEQRMALSLVAVEGKSYAEAADILEVPVGTIMSRIARARATLLKNRDTPD